MRSLNRICPGEKPQSGKYERDGLVDVSKMETWMTAKPEAIFGPPESHKNHGS